MGNQVQRQILKREPVIHFEPVPLEELRVRQMRRRILEQLLDASKQTIDSKAEIARNKKLDSFVLRYDGSLGSGVFSDTRVADIVRAWTWHTYAGSLGLERCFEINGETRITFCLR